MENQFQLEQAVNNTLSEIASKGTLTTDDVRQLKSHFHDTIADLRQKDLTEEEAFHVAKLRLGNPEELSLEFQKVNGISIVSKEWVFIFIGAGLAVLANSFLESSRIGIAYLNAKGTLSTPTATYLLAAIYILMVMLVILTFERGETLILFFKQKVFAINTTTTTITLFAVAVGFLTFIPLSRFFGHEVFKESMNYLVRIDQFNWFTQLIFRGSIPITIGLAILLSAQSINKKPGWNMLLRSNNYLYILLLGFGLEIAAATLGRMPSQGTSYGPIIFGAVILIGILLFAYHNSGESHLWRKISCLIISPLFIELFAGIQRGNGDWVSSPLFFYGIGTIISTLLGMIGCFFIYTKKFKASRQTNLRDS